MREVREVLLFDEHLSPRLCRTLANEFPHSVHVHDVGLGNVADSVIWQFALEKNLAIVTKDSDFPDLQGAKGFPPKIVWVHVGNCSTTDIETILRDHQGDILGLMDDPNIGLLIIR